MEGQVAVHILKIDPENIEQPEKVIEVAEIGKGEAFGDYALLHNDRRGASIYVKEPSKFLVLYKQEYLHILGKVEAYKLKEKCDFLQSLPLFKRWTDRKLIKTSYAFEVRYYTRNQLLFNEGDPTDKVYIVKEGEFQLIKNCKYMKTVMFTKKIRQSPVLKAQVKQVQVAIVGRGEMIGEDDVIKEQPHASTCKCLSTTGILLEISVKHFYKRIVNRETLRIMRESTDIRLGGREKRLKHYKSLEKSPGYSETPSPIKQRQEFSFKPRHNLKAFSSQGRNKSLRSLALLDKTLEGSPLRSNRMLPVKSSLLRSDSVESLLKTIESAKETLRCNKSPIKLSRVELDTEAVRDCLNFTSDQEISSLRKIFPLIRQNFSRTNRGIKLHSVHEGLVISSPEPRKA